MSKEDDRLSGLQYLSRERPEAMEHLLAFFKESARHLDPKTRFLISIVTKVINFSPRGLRQYIPRAMREGASRDEIIDAILCAYPAAGLTRVVDSIDVLRSLDLDDDPGAATGGATESAVETEEGEWIPVLKVGDVEVGSAKAVSAKGKRIAIFNVGGTYRAISNTCLHEGGYLAQGTVEGEVVTCIRHGWRFDVTNGDCVSRPGRSVASYDVQVEGDDVQVFV